ncbi:MAG TPA: hypothetical protein VGB18_01750 [Candidatus Thermoplasmatota archaeon]
MRRAVLVVGILLLAGCTGRGDEDPAPTTTPGRPALEPLESLTWSGTDCAEIGLFIRVPAANVRPFVHKNFTITEAQGQATLAVGFARCVMATVLENQTNNLVISDVAVFIEDPEGGPAPAFYQFWHASNRAATFENMSRVGLRTQEAPNSNFLTFGLVQATLAESRIASNEGEYSAQATSVPGSAAIPARSFRWWHASDANGTLYTDFTLGYKSAGPARGNVTAESGSDLARMFGETTVEGEGVFWTFDLTTTSRRTTP